MYLLESDIDHRCRSDVDDVATTADRPQMNVNYDVYFIEVKNIVFFEYADICDVPQEKKEIPRNLSLQISGTLNFRVKRCEKYSF